MSEVQRTISRNVGVLRAVRGLRTDEAVAEILGVSISTVNKKMSGARKWNLEEVEALATYFRIPANRLLGDPSDLLDPMLKSTGTDGVRSSNGVSRYVPADRLATILPFPLVERSTSDLPDVGTVIPLQRAGYHTVCQPSLTAAG